MNKYTTLHNIQKDLKSGKISCTALTQYYLKNIKQQSSLNIFLEVFEKQALEQAKQIDDKLHQGKTLGSLFGLVISVKDNICYKNHSVSAASKMLEGFLSTYSATAVERLLHQDAIIIGRVNCDEFAMGSTNENSAFGAVKNPINPAYVPGGSSGGSAAAVKAGMCHAALGSDTGGSIRQPASFCDVVGLKPSYGRVSRHGLIAFASSFDQIGPLTLSVEDAARILQVISGKDTYDATSASAEVPSYVKYLDKKVPPKKIAYFKNAIEHFGLDKTIKEKTVSLIQQLKKDGHTVKEVDFPLMEYLVPTYYVLTTAEASSNLSRYDGIHYGYRTEQTEQMDDVYLQSRTKGFGKEVKNRIMLGTFVLSTGYYDAYYSQAQKVRRMLRNQTNKLFEAYDFILSPSSPTLPFKIGEMSDNPVAMYLADVYTVLANLVGCPAISIPLYKNSEGLPIGIQFMGKNMHESSLLTFTNSLMKKK